MDSTAAPDRLPRMHSIGIGELNFSPNGKFLLSSGLDGKLLVWDVEGRRLHRELRGHAAGAYIYTAKFSSDNKTIASSGTEPKIKIWNLGEPPGQEFVIDLPLLGGANRLAFTRDGRTLAVGSGNRSISMWTVDGWRKIFQLNTLVGIRSVYGFHPERGDLAFDGEQGAIRIIPSIRSSEKSVPIPQATMNGMDVLFDGREAAPVTAGDFEEMRAGSDACLSARSAI
jgi:WD40 repeat protein